MKTLDHTKAHVPFLPSLSSPSDLKALSIEEIEVLSQEIRDRIIQVLSTNGGHLASNLGIVELTLALHFVFHSPYDKLIFDTSHQTYPHKLLTGRNERFTRIRQYQGLCGFAHPQESEHDHFYAGHAGTAFSLALGLAKQRDLDRKEEHIIPILGDASLTCGLTLEALNNIPQDLKRFIVILNDNEMSISQNVGHIKNMLSRLLSNPTSNRLYEDIQSLLSKVPGCGTILEKLGKKTRESLKNFVSSAPFFEEFGLAYVGPVDGHDLKMLIHTLHALQECPYPVLLHVITQKGKGMPIAADNPTSYHGVKPFDPDSGEFLPSNKKPTFPKIFGQKILELAEKHSDLICLTPAMPAGSCLEALMKKYPERCLDVGIAEGHCVTFAGALTYQKKKKVIVSIYATFLQRALDNLFHDVCMQRLPVIFALDRAFLSGPDGSSHHGIYDIAFLNNMPDLILAQARDGKVLQELLEDSLEWNRPTAIRYPNLVTQIPSIPKQKRLPGNAELLAEGDDLLLIALGHMCNTAYEVREHLLEKGLECAILDPVFLKPLDEECLLSLAAKHHRIVTIEEHALNGGMGSIINQFLLQKEALKGKILNIGIPDQWVQFGSHKELLQELKLDALSIEHRILQEFFLL